MKINSKNFLTKLAFCFFLQVQSFQRSNEQNFSELRLWRQKLIPYKDRLNLKLLEFSVNEMTGDDFKNFRIFRFKKEFC